MLVLVFLVAGGAWLFGLPGALGAYVLGLVGFSFLPEKGAACSVPPERLRSSPERPAASPPPASPAPEGRERTPSSLA